MTFLDPDTPEQPLLPKPPAALLVFFGALLVLGAITVLVSLADNATYFGHSHEGLIWSAAVFVWFPAAWVCAHSAWTYVTFRRNSRFGRVIGAGYAGIFGGFLVAMMVHAIGSRIDHAVLFPAAATRTYAQVEAPISDAYATHGKGAGKFVWLPPLPDPLQVTNGDYAAMFARRRASDPAADADQFRVGGTTCALVTVQVSGGAIRILRAGWSGLPDHSLHPCPATYDDLFARLSVEQD